MSLAIVSVPLVLLAPTAARTRHSKGTAQLVQVIMPTRDATAPAHPDVNVIVRFVLSGDGSPFANVASLRVRLNGRNVTGDFTPLLDHDTQVGVRAAIRRDDVKVGPHRANRLRLLVHGRQPDANGRIPRQIARVRFRAEEAQDRPPVADIVADSQVLRPGVVVSFDGSQSFDPESDALSYLWDFGDGSHPSTEAMPTHVFADAGQSRIVRLTVNDGQASGSATVTLLSCSQRDGFTPGTLALGADAPLEFGAVPVGGSATRSVEVRNTSADPNSLLSVCVAVDGGGFAVAPARVDLRAHESGIVTVTFAPGAQGHAAATITLATSADNRPSVSLLGHGYGGTAPGPGPTKAATPVFYTVFAAGLGGSAVKGFLPDGTPIAPDTGVHACLVPGDGSGTGDACLVDADCAPNGGSCPQSSVCAAGDRAGQPCTLPGDCPGAGAAGCPSYGLFDVAELCAGGSGDLSLLSNDGSFTDPAPSDTDAELSEVVLGVTLDGGGNATGHSILTRTTSETNHIACDGIAAGAGGRALLAEYHQVPDSGDCVRSDKEELVAVNKGDGSRQTLLPRIDAAEGLSSCDDSDLTTHLEVSADGTRAFASFDSGGLWRLTPTPLQFVDQSYQEDTFRLQPDGAIVFATVSDGPTAATVRVFKLSEGQVASNALPEAVLTPCGVFHIPNNHGATGRRSRVAGIGVSPATVGSQDGTVLVSVTTSPLADPGADAASQARANNLTVRATLAFSSPADSASCPALGVINLEGMDQLTF
jgi:PKD repeat protein